jgi:membrane fusion protein (multidrug efflux system)
MDDAVPTPPPQVPPTHDSNHEASSPVPSEEGSNHKRHFWMITLSLFFLFILIGFFLMWLFIWQYEESTQDAYVAGNIVRLSSQISAPISCIFTDNTNLVVEGQLLVLLDDTVTRVNLEQAKATLAQSVRQVTQLFENVHQLHANVEVQKSQLELARLEYDRRKELIKTNAVSVEDLENNRSRFNIAQSNLVYALSQLQAAIAQVHGTTVHNHPTVEQSKATLRSSFVSQFRTQVFCPTRGYVAKRVAQVGQWVNPGDPLLSIVPLFDIWVDANFKETQLKNMRIGQPVELIADMYGGDVIYHGKVVGLTPGSGDVFDILPPQNATGNWIKIVQRVPVRISLDPKELEEHPLVLGLSMDVTVSTRDLTGEVLAYQAKKDPIYTTEIFEGQGSRADELIEEIVRKNMGP